MIDLEKMAEQHKQLFPHATLESQVWKLEEECKEMFEAKEPQKAIEEMADVLIVLGGLYRWLPFTAYTFSELLAIIPSVEQEVNRKWQINLKRKWEWNGKTYHHIEEQK